MRYLSMFSGIEAATVAWHPLGWTPAAFCEIEPFPSAVLRHHYPEVPSLGDVTKADFDSIGEIDLAVFGSPCQSFSVAGKRLGLDDPRGNLALLAGGVVSRKRARWFVFENVPGLLSSDGGFDFGTLLAAFAGYPSGSVFAPPAAGWGSAGVVVQASSGSYGLAWRVLDAQYFGVAQRRRRVFVVGYLGDWRRATAVLFERHSLSGHPAPRREKGKSAPTIPSRSSAGGGLGTDFDCDGGLIAGALAPSLTSNPYGDHESREGLLVAAYGGNNTAGAIDVATALSAHGGPHGRQDFESETFVAHTLKGEGFDASKDGTGRGTGRGTPLVPVTFAIQERAVCENPNAGPDGTGFRDDGAAYTLEARSVPQAVAFNITPSNSNKDYNAREAVYAQALTGSGGAPSARGGDLITFDTTQITSAANYSNPKPGDACHPLAAGAHPPAIAGSAVRRLTPRECERLQGFPDDYTLIPWRGGMAPDGPRYKALGNSMAVPVMAWIGQRIEAVEALALRRAA